jgi:hypothetical protein
MIVAEELDADWKTKVNSRRLRDSPDWGRAKKEAFSRP